MGGNSREILNQRVTSAANNTNTNKGPNKGSDQIIYLFLIYLKQFYAQKKPLEAIFHHHKSILRDKKSVL
jgi:hypothetical protein